MLRKLLLLSFILGLSYCTLWVGGYSHLEQLKDDEHVGKTLLIYPSAGKFVPDKSWYFGKLSGDSYLSSQRSIRDSKTPPVLYIIAGKYRKVNHGSSLLAGDGFTKYLVNATPKNRDRRLFFSITNLEGCKEQTDLFDQNNINSQRGRSR